MAGRLRLKIGPIEVEYDGDLGVSNADVLTLAEAAADLYTRKRLGDSEGARDLRETDQLRIQGSAASIASRLNCISGPELIVAAAAWLTFVRGEEWFEPVRLLQEMKTASAHYDSTYEETLADDIRGLVQSGKLEQMAPNLYTLSATMRRHLQQALAE